MKDEIQKIRITFIKADYTRSFVKSVTSLHNNKIKEQKIDNDEDYIISPYLSEDKKPFILLKLLKNSINLQMTTFGYIVSALPSPPQKKMSAWGDLKEFLSWIIVWGHTMYIAQKKVF